MKQNQHETLVSELSTDFTQEHQSNFIINSSPAAIKYNDITSLCLEKLFRQTFENKLVIGSMKGCYKLEVCR